MKNSQPGLPDQSVQKYPVLMTNNGFNINK